MKKKHYSGKELLYRRQMEKQQQRTQNAIRQRIQYLNRLKKAVEAAPPDIRQNQRKEREE